MTEHTSRRSFLSAGALAGAGSLMTAAQPQAAENKPARKLKVGALGATTYSFWGIWADLLSPQGRAGTELLNMEVSLVWDKDYAEAEKFAAKWGCQAVKKYDDMIGKVDGVASGGLYEAPWQHKMFKPYLKAGMPCYLSRPWSSRIKDLDEMLELAAKNNAPLMATATYEHYNEANTLGERIKNLGPIKCVYATDTAGDFPHFHLQYMMLKILGYHVEKVSLISNDLMKPNYLQDTYLYAAKDDQPPFACTMNSARGSYIFYITVIGEKGTEISNMPGNSDWYYRFVPQMIDIQKTIEGKTYQPLDIVHKKFEIFMAAKYSHHERNGSPVAVGSVPVDWSYPHYMPGWMDDSMFKD